MSLQSLTIQKFYTLRAKVEFLPYDLTIGIQIFPDVRMMVIKPWPACSFIFYLRLQNKRPILDTVCEMVSVISTANILAFTVAAFIGYMKHREEVVTIFQYLKSAIPFL